jgi:hypothetical protein
MVASCARFSHDPTETSEMDRLMAGASNNVGGFRQKAILLAEDINEWN